jgi:uncharacterized protein YlxP (DUF503 family)
MTVNVMTVKLYAPWVHSLKKKRKIVKSLCERLRNKFNVSVIESDAQDIHQTIIISIAFLSNQAAMADSICEAIQNFIERSTDADIVDIIVEKR